ncbi:MAG TPA: amidohydrolase family protein [Acidimicrobiales bacterium]|nr:amidohydrolase family protein [Acidimicrobiales bacterium]
MAEHPARGFDADNHYYEAMDAFTRHIELEYAKRAMQWAEVNGKTRLLVGGKINTFIPNPTFDRVAKPGSLEQFFRAKNASGQSVIELFGELAAIDPAYRDRDIRLKVMEDQGLDGAFFFPTLGVGMEQALLDDLPAMMAAFRAFNRWLDEDWGFHYQERIFAAPYITLADTENAIAELEWALGRGARIVVMQTGPVMTALGWRSPADAMFDPYWRRIEEAGISVAYHGGDTAYGQILPMWGDSARLESFRNTTLRAVLSPVPIADTLAALIVGGVFARFPGLRVAAIETGAEWVAPLFYRLGKSFGQTPQLYPEDPRQVFRHHIWVAPFYENDLRQLAELIGPTQMLMGTDWPHTEGLANPLNFADDLLRYGFSPTECKQIMHHNAAGLVAPPT